MTDTKFSVAIHILVLISQAPDITSKQLAQSVGTNASYIRKVLALLKNAGIVEGHKGRRGYTLKISPEKLTLLEIYQAVTGDVHILDIHQNPSDQCQVGKHIKPVLTSLFNDMEKTFSRSLSAGTLADCIAGIRLAMEN